MKTKRLLAGLLSVCIIGGAMTVPIASAAETAVSKVAAQEEHIVYDEETAVLTLHGEFTSSEVRNFRYISKVETIIAAEDTVFPENCNNIFYFCKNCKKIDLSKADTSKINVMQSMFSGCESLTELDLSNFDTSNVKNMYYMFSSCSSLESLDISGFDTSNVETMKAMFLKCSSLKTVNFGKIDTSNLKSMDAIFSQCGSLEVLDLSELDLSNVTSKGYAFEDCFSLSSIKLGDKSGNITAAMRLFNFGWVNEKEPAEKVSGDGEFAVIKNTGVNAYTCNKPSGDEMCYSFDTATKTLTLHGKTDREQLSDLVFKKSVLKVIAEEGTVLPDDCSGMFNLYKSCTSIDLSKATGAPTNMSAMFKDCELVSTITMDNIDTSKFTDMSSMFEYCTKLSASCVEDLNTSSVTNMSHMLDGCWSFYDLDLSKYDTSNVTDMSYMLARSSAITSVDLSSFDTSKVEDMSYMFYYDHDIRKLILSSFDTSNVKNMTGMFDTCNGLETLFIQTFDTSNVTDMYAMFCNCENLKYIDLSHFNTANVENMGLMFSACRSAESIDISSFDNSASKGNSYMFARCDALKTLALGEKFSGITADMRLHNEGWSNKNTPDVNVSGNGEFAVIPNSGKNTYVLTGVKSEVLNGDSNSDGEIGVADLAALSSWLHGKKDAELKSSTNSDLNEDGSIDVFDLIQLRKLIIKNSK